MIRDARSSDVEQIAEVHVASWRTTYKGIVSEQFLRKLSVERKIDQWKQNIEQTDGFLFVAEEDGRIVGFVNGGKKRNDEFPYEGEIYAIYLLEEYQHRGIGKALFDRTVVAMATLGWKSLYVWVLEENHSKHFYEKMGGKAFDEDKLEIDGAKHREIAFGWEF